MPRRNRMYDWQNRLEEAYRRFPENGARPVVGITGNYGELTCKLAEGYYKSVILAGGAPVIIPPSDDVNVIIETLGRIDALILSGGGDYNPRLCGEEPWPELGEVNAERDIPELLTARLAYERNIPMLGICRGIQTLAMALEGHVRQDISDIQTLKHSQSEDRSVATHTVNIVKGSLLEDIYNCCVLSVNSFHHQAVDNAGQHFRVSVTSEDGIIEAMESCEHKPIIGVQWHPECLTGVWDEAPWTAGQHASGGLPLFRWLVDEAAKYRRAHALHDNIITLDSHCDTPMFFPQGVDFATRDPRILTDLHKMTCGRLDTTIMAAYIPQPQKGRTFSEIVPLKASSPGEYADIIFDKIEEISRSNGQHIAIARTPDDLQRNKHQGKKSIMLAIENGLAIEGSLDRLRHFARRGIVYMTLCHNGDNDICDSAKGTQTHGGVSVFGESVIREMNRLGVMVDMSHAGETSFYDALEISRLPIVCSHSNSRSLCDHPRNLTDHQMRALAVKGGVEQITLYPGFLRQGASMGTANGQALLREPSEATIIDALKHLEHAIKVMGIDHVGIGTDFDGDGGVPGFADAGDAINFTRHLLERRYSREDIAKIWGGNFLRVMREVQNARP